MFIIVLVHYMDDHFNKGFKTQLQLLIDSAADQKPASRDAIISHSCERLLRLTRSMFRSYPALRRWEQTDDVFQNSIIRLHRALMDVKVESVRHFFNLAALQIRRELLDLTKKHLGPEGIGAKHHSDGWAADGKRGVLHGIAAEPDSLAAWTRFHADVEKLPAEELEVFNLVYYEGLTQEEASVVLGISFRTLKRRWQSARVRLQGELDCEE